MTRCERSPGRKIAGKGLWPHLYVACRSRALRFFPEIVFEDLVQLVVEVFFLGRFFVL